MNITLGQMTGLIPIVIACLTERVLPLSPFSLCPYPTATVIACSLLKKK